jgi:hypothetical protein
MGGGGGSTRRFPASPGDGPDVPRAARRKGGPGTGSPTIATSPLGSSGSAQQNGNSVAKLGG